MCKLQRFFYFPILFFAFFSAIGVQSQEIHALVSVNYEQIPIDQRQEIGSMKQDVETYINSVSYTGKQWDGDKIPVDITIYLMSRSGNSYTAKLFIVSKRILDAPGKPTSVTFRFLDDQWDFEYGRNAYFTFQPNKFDAFSSLLDYYMCLSIGMDMDTYAELSGIGMYEKARQIVSLGYASGATGYKQAVETADYTRQSMINEITDIRMEPFRRLIYSYFDGMENYAKDKSKGLELVDGVLSSMVKFKYDLGRNSTLFQVFFDAKYQELCDMFKGGSTESFKKMKYLDPGHTSAYEKAQEK